MAGLRGGGSGGFYSYDDPIGELCGGESFYPFKRGPGAIPGEVVGVGMTSLHQTKKRS